MSATADGIPPEVFEVTLDRFGPAGLLPSLVTDGGAAVLSLILVISLAAYPCAPGPPKAVAGR